MNATNNGIYAYEHSILCLDCGHVPGDVPDCECCDAAAMAATRCPACGFISKDDPFSFSSAEAAHDDNCCQKTECDWNECLTHYEKWHPLVTVR